MRIVFPGKVLHNQLLNSYFPVNKKGLIPVLPVLSYLWLTDATAHMCFTE